MSYKKATYATLLLFILLGLGYLKMAGDIVVNRTDTMGPHYFPTLLGIALIVLCLISWIQTARKQEDGEVRLSNLKFILWSIVVSVLYFAAWEVFGYFYVITFVYLMILFMMLSDKKTIRVWLFNAVVSLGLLLFIYLIFDKLLSIRL